MGQTPGVPNIGDLAGSIADGMDKLQDVIFSIGDKATELEVKMGVPRPIATIIGGVTAGVGLFVYIIVSMMTALLIPIAVPLITLMMSMIMKIRQDTLPAQAELSAAALSEFLGTEISPESMLTGKGPANAVAVAQGLGDALYNRLYAEFGLSSGGAVGPGEKAARTFSGFAVNFATQNAMISTLADALSFHELQEFRELGVEVARNLGIGRLQRMALGTLLQQVIQKPFQRELAYKVRPDRLSVTEYIHAHNRGDITLDQLQQNLAEAGYRDQDIQAVINEYTDRLGIAELVTLVRWGQMTEDTAISTLQRQGLDAATAALRFQAAQLAITNDNVTRYVDSLNQAVRARTIDSDTWTSLMQDVPWTQDEKDWEKRANGAYLDFYQRMLTWTQVITAYEQGIVDVDYVEKWLVDKGYSPDDVLNMELLLAVKFDAFAAAAAKKGGTAPAKKPAPPA